MLLPSWIARVLRLPSHCSRRQRRASRRKLPAFRPRLENLEDRVVPSIEFTQFSVPATTPSRGTLTLNGVLNDSNYPNSVSVTIDWGDGTSPTIVSAKATSTPGQFQFTASHAYPNQPSASKPVFIVEATASDNLGASTSSPTEAALVTDGLQGSESITIGPGANNLVQATVETLTNSGTFTNSFDRPVDGGPIVVFGSSSTTATDAIVVNEGLALPVTIYGGTQDTLTVQDPIPADTILLANNTVTANGSLVTYSGLSSLLVSGLGGGDTVNMTGIAAGVAVTVNGVSSATVNSIVVNPSFTGNFGDSGFNGNLTLDNFPTVNFTDNGNFSGDLTVNSPGNLQSLSVAGSITAGSSITVTGTLSNSSIGTNAGTIRAGSISGMSVTDNSSGGSILVSGSITSLNVITNSGAISLAGTGTASNVSISTNNGTFEVGQTDNPDAGAITSSTVGTNNGTVSAGTISGMTVTLNNTNGSLLAGSMSGLKVTENAGRIFAHGQSTISNTSIGTNSGTVSAGSISTMTVSSNSGSISAAGAGTTSDVTIGNNSGTFVAVYDGSTLSGTMTHTSIGSNSGTVKAGDLNALTDGNLDAGEMVDTIIGTNNGTISTGAINNMALTTNKQSVLAGSMSGLKVTENAGRIFAHGQSTISNTSIGTNSGTVSAGSISTMTVSSNSGSISAAGAGTTSDVTIGNNSGTFVAKEDSNPGSGTMSETTIGTNSGVVSAGTISTMSVTTNSGIIRAAAPDPGNASNVTIGTLGASGVFTVTGTLTSLNITVFSGLVAAGHIDSITATNAPGASQMLNLVDGGVTRRLVLAPATTGGSLPQFVNYVYDHNPVSGDAQLTMAVQDGATYPAADSYDVELLSSSAAPGSGFDLAALYNRGSTPAHIRNVLIEGNLVPYTGDASQVGITSTVGGVQLPGTPLASVGILGNAPAGSVRAASVEAVSFASLSESDGQVAIAVAAPHDDDDGKPPLPPGEHPATPKDAAQLLAPGTAIVQANNTFLAAAGQNAQGQSQPVALFLDTSPPKSPDDQSDIFDPHVVLLGNQGNILGATSPVLAQVTATIPSDEHGEDNDHDDRSLIQSISLSGDGGSIQTAQPIASAITSSGALGDLILQSDKGIEANVTAPSIFGNIAATNGPISGIIQTTTGNIGRLLTAADGSITGVTFIQARHGFSGQIISANDLISQITVDGGDGEGAKGLRGVLAAGGNLGYLDPSTLKRFGGLVAHGGFNGDLLVLGNIYGNIVIDGGLDGRIAAQGAANGLAAGRQGILGDIKINGEVGSEAAIVSGGEIGDAGLGTELEVHGAYKGILAAVGTIAYDIDGSTKFASIFNDVGNPNSPQYDGGVNEAAIDAIFSGLTIGDLTTLLLNLNNLHVSNGNLSDA